MSTQSTLANILATLSDEANPDACVAMRDQYGIHAQESYGVPMRRLLQIAKGTGPDHRLALQLWAQGSYEARSIAAMVDEPELVTSQQMQQWCADFDNWAIVDTVCFRLFDRTAHAWPMVDQWVENERLFGRRAGFALLWSLALHDREAPDQRFRAALAHAQTHARDPRPLVGKSITMAMRAIATKRPLVRQDVVTVAQLLAEDPDPAARRVGRPILRSFTSSGARS